MDINEYLNASPVTADGEVLGDITEVFLDNATNEPTWAVVEYGLLNKKHAVVCLRNAKLSGGTLSLDVDKQRIEDAPLPASLTHLSGDEEEELNRHYFG